MRWPISVFFSLSLKKQTENATKEIRILNHIDGLILIFPELIKYIIHLQHPLTNNFRFNESALRLDSLNIGKKQILLLHELFGDSIKKFCVLQENVSDFNRISLQFGIDG